MICVCMHCILITLTVLYYAVAIIHVFAIRRLSCLFKKKEITASSQTNTGTSCPGGVIQ